jgi:hypothetical protein
VKEFFKALTTYQELYPELQAALTENQLSGNLAK